uniref:TIL domain-containing protein n=1 Tax=Anopheles atroparvus TaxID=41427 RepID=A0AAG5D592_ANOAO
MGYSKVLLLVTIVLAVLALVPVVYAQEPPVVTCSDPNEYYTDCGPVCGDRTCANKNKNDVTCLRSCGAGCFCQGGYVRSKSY